MTRSHVVRHQFVELMPKSLHEGVLYVSIPYATAIHMCCCGCGNKVVTPLSPTDWSVTYDGETISLHPSIGNWSFPCQSHYWIRNNRVQWAESWTPSEIAAGRTADRQLKEVFLARGKKDSVKTRVTGLLRRFLAFCRRVD